MRPLRAFGCLYKSRKEGTKEKVGSEGGGRGLQRPRGRTDPGQLRVKVPAQEIQAQDPFKHLPNVCLRTGNHWMERSLPWGDVFCLRKHVSWESRAAEAGTSGSSKHASWRGLNNKQKLTTRCHVHEPLPRGASAGEAPVRLRPAGRPRGGDDSALQRSRERAPLDCFRGCSGMHAPDSASGWAHWGLVLRTPVCSCVGFPRAHLRTVGKRTIQSKATWVRGKRGGVSPAQMACAWFLGSG